MTPKKILFAHSGGSQGAKGRGSYDLVAYLRNNLGKKYEVLYPIIPDPEAPDYLQFKEIFDLEFAKAEDELVLIGHSLGGSVLLKYLSENPVSVSLASLHLVASPFWGMEGWEIDEFYLRKNFEQFLPAIPEIHLYHSREDPIVSYEHLQTYSKRLPKVVVHTLWDEDHAFAKGLPVLLEQVSKIRRKYSVSR